jgi:hypothetical protein
MMLNFHAELFSGPSFFPALPGTDGKPPAVFFRPVKGQYPANYFTAYAVFGGPVPGGGRVYPKTGGNFL